MVSIEELQLINFKSFRRATIVIPRGLIAITGPNGSGKSNILDAIAFLMGWRARRLRASRLEHLVRRGAPWAQVSLVVNSGERFRISRRVRPNGVSSYRVNGKPLRASQVADVLSSIGLIAERYTFVTQGDITSVIEMTPQERYRMLEEISGVSEYDEKREKALEELNEVEQLLREVSAVLRERERELKRVEEELRALEERRHLEERINGIRKHLILTELRSLKERLSSLEEPRIEEEVGVESLREELERREEELRHLEAKVRDSPVRRRGQIEVELNSLRRQRDALRKALEAKEEIMSSLMRERELPGFLREDPSFLGTISELIRPMQGYELPFLAAGLGRLNDIVVRDLEGAKRIAKKLRNWEGRFRIIPIDVLQVREHRDSLGTALYNFLIFDPEYEALAKHIFGAVLLEDLEDVRRELIGRARFVTMRGEVVEREGSIVAGAPERSLGNFSRIVEEVNSLRAEVHEIDEEISRKERELSEIPDRDPNLDLLDGLRKAVQELRRRYQDALARREANIRQVRRLMEERSDLIAKIRILEGELEDLSGAEPIEVQDPRKELLSLEIKLKSMGQVNPRAPEEYERRKREFEEIRERYEYFSSKKREIEGIISKIDNERENVLKSTLAKLSNAFNEWIRVLFDGGEGELFLSIKGLEIMVSIPGKSSVSLDSLSGGEKSLCALAFILASQKVKSSLLYLFDEADAMLDGLNCKRYARALRELAKSSVVIVVSLKRETLEEADYIIGVTMRGGESKVVAVERGSIEG
ncbi:MAG: AAA family ATPase [Candidatus Korarchaeum sp.]